ncbi:Peptide methionine sulfoxide reductase A4, chloroplastic [Salvia divinorum]|uniref:peptide-methionine (S)-S-oxide reductase n=1 Tax=Salvia divinorum TaxID=28513 RepID=A0ABD1FMJ9_SALDI
MTDNSKSPAKAPLPATSSEAKLYHNGKSKLLFILTCLNDAPAPGHQFAQFGLGCFWGPELAYQRVPGVTKTEVGYTQGYMHNPTYEDICSGTTNHSEVVRVQYDPKECSYDSLLDVFWANHDPTTPNRQGNDVGTQYRSAIYFYTTEQEKTALESSERQQKLVKRKIADVVSSSHPRKAAMIQFVATAEGRTRKLHLKQSGKRKHCHSHHSSSCLLHATSYIPVFTTTKHSCSGGCGYRCHTQYTIIHPFLKLFY